MALLERMCRDIWSVPKYLLVEFSPNQLVKPGVCAVSALEPCEGRELADGYRTKSQMDTQA